VTKYVQTAYFFAGGNARSPWVNFSAYPLFFSSKLFWIAVTILGNSYKLSQKLSNNQRISIKNIGNDGSMISALGEVSKNPGHHGNPMSIYLALSLLPLVSRTLRAQRYLLRGSHITIFLLVLMTPYVDGIAGMPQCTYQAWPEHLKARLWCSFRHKGKDDGLVGRGWCLIGGVGGVDKPSLEGLICTIVDLA
jgi:hypothetical protein